MRIAHVTDCYLPRLGGIEMQVHDLARRQAAHHDVTVYTTTVTDRPEEDPSLEVVRLATRGGPDDIRYRASDRGWRQILASQPDLVHVHASSFSPLAFLAARNCSRAGIPTAATVHSLWAKATPLFAGADVLAGWGGWPVAWSAVSNAAAHSMRGIVAERGRVAIIPNGIDVADWSGKPPVRDASRLRIASVSRLAPRKRPYQMLQMLRAARRRLPESVELSAVIVGEGPERARLERYLRQHRMDSWVHLQGRLSRTEIRSVYSEADLFVAPAHLESFGIAALEARCAGLPVLALASTGVRDFVRHGEEGWLVGSDRAMTDTIVALATAPALLERVAAHNRAVPPCISWDSVLADCDALYRTAFEIQGSRYPARLTSLRSGVPSQS